MLSRRALIMASTSSWLLSGLPRSPLALPSLHAQPSARKRPRYFVTFFLRGGMDAIYTFDPKTKAEVEARVDVPYDANAIIDAGGVPLGPHFAPLRPFANQLAFVRGLRVKIANHETGALQMMRLRTGVTAKMPSIYDVIGQKRDTQALASVVLGDLTSFEHSPGALIAPTGNADGKTSLDLIDAMSPDEADALATVYARHLKQFPQWDQSPQALYTKESYTQLAAFFDRMRTTKRFAPSGKNSRAYEDAERTLWLLENDLATGVCIKVFLDWDSHFRNAEKQTQATSSFLKVLNMFLSELHSRKNAHGSLAEQTVVVLGSELGRFPVLNDNQGKDHWPETGLMLFGPTVKPGVYNPTGKMMEGSRLSLETGKPDANGTPLYLDDIGTTVMGWAGLDPETYGYQGRRLKFLEA